MAGGALVLLGGTGGILYAPCTSRCTLPHGGVRRFHQKSTCLHAINFRASFGANFLQDVAMAGGSLVLLGGSIRDNIFFGLPEDASFYAKV